MQPLAAFPYYRLGCMPVRRWSVGSGLPAWRSLPFNLISTGAIMNFLIWIVIGGIIGWVASIVMRTNAQQGLFLNIVVGIVGALIGGWLISPLLGAATINQNDFSLSSLLVSFIGALILLAIVNFFQRGRAR